MRWFGGSKEHCYITWIIYINIKVCLTPSRVLYSEVQCKLCRCQITISASHLLAHSNREDHTPEAPQTHHRTFCWYSCDILETTTLRTPDHAQMAMVFLLYSCSGRGNLVGWLGTRFMHVSQMFRRTHRFTVAPAATPDEYIYENLGSNWISRFLRMVGAVEFLFVLSKNMSSLNVDDTSNNVNLGEMLLQAACQICVACSYLMLSSVYFLTDLLQMIGMLSPANSLALHRPCLAKSQLPTPTKCWLSMHHSAMLPA